MSKKVIIIGGEGNGGVIASCIDDNRERYGDMEWEVAGFVNDYEKEVCGYPVLGKIDDVPKLLENPDYYFMWAIHTIGRNTLIEKTFNKVRIPLNRFATIIHNSAFVAKNAILEPGCFIMANCYVGPQSHLGMCCMMMANSLLGHNNIVGPFCHFSIGSMTSSYNVIGKCSSVAFGTVVLEKRKIGDFAVAGAHSLITHDIPDYEIHVGSPAKFLKRITDANDYKR